MTQHANRMLERLREECHDAIDYAKMADQVTADGEEWLAKKLRIIAYEEYTHAYTIRRALLMSDVTIDPDTCRLFKEAEEIAGR